LSLKVLVLGGTGVISRGIVDKLLENNHDVTIYNRGSKSLPFHKEINQLTGDRQNREQFENQMRALKCDVVIDMICFDAEDAKSTVRAFKGNVEQMIVCSSIAAYKRPYNSLPISEDREQLTDDPTFGYAYKKAEMERYFHNLIETEKLPATLFRPSLTYGPGAANIGVLRQNYNIIDRIRKGKPLVMFGDGTTPWSFTFVPDLAKGVAGLVGNKLAYGQAYHITSEEITRWEDLYLEFGHLIGKQPEIRHIPSELLHKASPDLFAHLYYEKSYAGIFDNSKIKKAVPGFKAEITLREGLRSMLDWFEKEANHVDPQKQALEDSLVELHDQWSKQAENLGLKLK